MKNSVFKLLWFYLKRYKLVLFIFLFFTALNYTVQLFTPLLFGLVIEALTDGNWNNFIFFILMLLSLKIFGFSIINIPADLAYNYLESNFVKNVTKDMYKRINNLPAYAFEEKGTGEITNRLTSDPKEVMNIFSHIVRLVCKFISFIFIIIIIINISWIIAIEVLIFMVAMSILLYVILPRFEKMEKINKENTDAAVKTMTEYVVGVREVKALGIKESVNQNIFSKVDKLLDNIRRTNNNMSVFWNLNYLVFFIFEAVIFTTAGYFVISGNIGIALFVTLQTYIWRIDAVVESLGTFFKDYSKVKVSLTRIDEIVNNRLYKDEVYGNKELTSNSGFVKFDNVVFKYKGDASNTLKGMDLVCEPNKKTAIIGRSGNGKSTIFNLLVRYFDATSGKVLIDDINIKDLTEESLRKNISIIRQSPHIFNMSIMDNLRLVKEDATDEEIYEVCKKAYLHDYIISLSKGYNTMIGEGGVNLSGGQKQRLAIARTLLINTKIILFDEATSALDNESQEYIKKTIDNLSKDHTVIIVAHRLSTIIDADVINVVLDGKVVETGTHKKLIKKSKVYKGLYQSEL